MTQETVLTLGGRMSADGWAWSRHILGCVSNGVTIADATLPHLPLIYVNPAFERMTGYTAAEVLGRSCNLLQGPEKQQDGLAELRRALRDRTDVRVVLRNYRKDGTLFWNELYLSPVWDDTGTLIHYVGIQNDVTAATQDTARLTFRANHDDLTGLVNRGLLMDRMEQAILRARLGHEQLAILFFDLDGFKAINDTYGHDTGDAVLQITAQRLRAAVRDHETVARLGGDEFVAILEAFGNEATCGVRVEEILNDLRAPITFNGQQFRTVASLGLAYFPRDGSSCDELLQHADQSMYLDKQRHKAFSVRRRIA